MSTMLLYKAVDTKTAADVVANGFAAATTTYETHQGDTVTFVEFRDLSPTGATLTPTAELGSASDGAEPMETISGVPVLGGDPGDFILAIDVPTDEASRYEAIPETPEEGPLHEFYLDPELADRYRHTLMVFDSHDGDEVRLDLVGK